MKCIKLSYSELNFLQIIQWTHLCLFQKWSNGGSKDLPFLKYINVPKWESRFTLGPNAAENTNFYEKMFQIKVI